MVTIKKYLLPFEKNTILYNIIQYYNIIHIHPSMAVHITVFIKYTAQVFSAILGLKPLR